MPTTGQNMTYNPTLLRSRYGEEVTRAALGLIERSNGAITLESEAIEGDALRIARFKRVPNLVSRRITKGTGSDGQATKRTMSQSDEQAARLSRNVGPLLITFDAMRKANMDETSFTNEIAKQMAEEEIIDELDAAAASAVGALTGTTGAVVDRTVTGIDNKKASNAALVAGLRLMGDMGSRVVAWMMSSAAYYDLMDQQIDPSETPFPVGANVLYGASPASLGRPSLVTDAPALSPDDHWILGLTRDALQIRVDNMPIMGLRINEDLEAMNAGLIVRSEFDYAVNVKGYAYDDDDNPENAALASTANWGLELSDIKSSAGIAIKVAG